MRSRWALRCFHALTLLLLAAPCAFAAKNLRIVSASYDQYFHRSEAPTFLVTVQNNEPTNEGVELVIISNNLDTEEESVLADVGSGAGVVLANGGTFTFQTAVGPLAAGIYTLTFRILDGDAARSDQLRGKFPIHIGTETESLRVFPDVINLGTIPPGRYMHPIPVEVSWSYFRFNELRRGQPFTIRIYSDNAGRFGGVPGAVAKVSPAGIVHMSGRYALPLKTWNLNYGPDIQETGWDATLAGPPPVEEDDYWLGPPLLEGNRNLNSASWARVPDLTDMTANPIGWRRLIGEDAYDSRFVSDLNLTGDFTLRSPFTFYMATEAGATAVEGVYSATLIVELWSP